MFSTHIRLTKFGPGFWSRALVPGFIPSLIGEPVDVTTLLLDIFTEFALWNKLN